MFAKLGPLIYRFRWAVIALWLAAAVASIPILMKADEPLKVGGFSSPDTESSRATQALLDDVGFSPSTIVVLFSSDTLDARSQEFQAEVRYALQPVSELSNVVSVVLPEEDLSLISENGRSAYALVGLDLPPDEAQRDVPAFQETLRTPPNLSMVVAGGPAFYADIETVSQQDLRRAELIAFPFALVALLIVFGTVVAAGVPLIVGGLGVAGVLTTLYFVGQQVDVSIFALNLASMLGLGLAIDYSLFITSRFREELVKANGDVEQAIETSIATAGRAIFFSGLTVLIGLSGLALFDFMFIRSVGISGTIVVFFSVFSALTFLPALLSVLGERIDRLSFRRNADAHINAVSGFWVRLSEWVMARPVMVLIPTMAFLLVLGYPFFHVQVSSPDATILPNSLPSRQAFNSLVEDYGPGEISPLVVVLSTSGSVFDPENLGALYDMAAQIEGDPRVTAVKSMVPLEDGIDREQAVELMRLQPGLKAVGIDTGYERLTSDQAVAILVYTDALPNAEESRQLLADVRAINPGGDFTMLVGGGTAEIVDVVNKMYGQFPLAILMIVTATYLVLMVLFRSLLLPLKAILMNGLSIVASYGAIVFIFQDGNLSNVLDFEPLGFVEASLPVIMFCVLFGLSMDYEVFLLSRIKEEWDRTGDNTRAVSLGMQRSGRIITSAALIVVVVTLSFVSADVILIKALGLGIAIAVLVDATIVRALVVPSTMRLMGKWNWWLPDSLARILPYYDLPDSEPTMPVTKRQQPQELV